MWNRLNLMEEKNIDNNILLYIILGTALIICTVTDLKYKEIYMPVFAAGNPAAIYENIEPAAIQQQQLAYIFYYILY